MALKAIIRRLKPKDKRLRALWYTAGALTLLTILLIIWLRLSGYDFSFEKFAEPIFISWIGGAALFIFSIVISIIQLDDPTEDGAARRIEILMQGKEGAHVDYFIEQLRTIEQYATSSERKIVLKRFSEDQTEIFVEVHTKSVIRNFIDDISTTYFQPLGLTALQVEKEGGVAYLRLDDQHQPKGQFGAGPNFTGTYPVTVPKGQSVRVDFGIYRWVKLGEAFNYTPAKYVKELTVSLENELPAVIDYSIEGRTIRCAATSSQRVYEAIDLRPRVMAYASTLRIAAA